MCLITCIRCALSLTKYHRCLLNASTNEMHCLNHRILIFAPWIYFWIIYITGSFEVDYVHLRNAWKLTVHLQGMFVTPTPSPPPWEFNSNIIWLSLTKKWFVGLWRLLLNVISVLYNLSNSTFTNQLWSKIITQTTSRTY